MDDDTGDAWQTLTLTLPNGQEKTLSVKVIQEVCWYSVTQQRPLQVVLVRDPDQKWRDEYLLSTDQQLSPAEVILGYMQRWSVEVCYWESKQLLGLHDAQVWSELAVQRTHPMAWFVGGLVLVWYAKYGMQEDLVEAAAPWYTDKKSPSFADMLATCRRHLWQHWYAEAAPEEQKELLDWLFDYISTATG
jgi:hypothetical protein